MRYMWWSEKTGPGPKGSQGQWNGVMVKEGYANEHVVKGYDWAAFGDGLLVDVGGSDGALSKAILEHLPRLRCVVQDRAAVVQSTEIPKDLIGRLEFLAPDFFTKQTVVANAYILPWVLQHNWSDPYALEILKQLVPALRDEARVIVVEMCLSKPGMLPLSREKHSR